MPKFLDVVKYTAQNGKTLEPVGSTKPHLILDSGVYDDESYPQNLPEEAWFFVGRWAYENPLDPDGERYPDTADMTVCGVSFTIDALQNDPTTGAIMGVRIAGATPSQYSGFVCYRSLGQSYVKPFTGSLSCYETGNEGTYSASIELSYFTK